MRRIVWAGKDAAKHNTDPIVHSKRSDQFLKPVCLSHAIVVGESNRVASRRCNAEIASYRETSRGAAPVVHPLVIKKWCQRISCTVVVALIDDEHFEGGIGSCDNAANRINGACPAIACCEHD